MYEPGPIKRSPNIHRRNTQAVYSSWQRVLGDELPELPFNAVNLSHSLPFLQGLPLGLHRYREPETVTPLLKNV